MVNRHHHGPIEPKGGTRIATAFFLNLFFTIVEIVGGVLTNSTAILSDAIHDLGDSLSLGLAWYFQKVSGKGRDRQYSYGYRRFSLLGAIVTSMVMMVGSVFILQEAIPRLIQPEELSTEGMVLLAILGIGVNGAAAAVLRKGKSLNERVVSLHLLEDVLGWAAVLLGAIVIHFTDWFIIDPILSIAITCWILYNVIKSIRSAFKIVLQGVPEGVDVAKLKDILTSIDGVASIHDLHVWSLDGEENILTVHVVAAGNLDKANSLRIREAVKQQMQLQNIGHCTVEIEEEDHIGDRIDVGDRFGGK